MKRAVLAVMLLFLSRMLAGAQQPGYFLFIEAEDSLPFYVRTAEKVFNSTEIGTLTIGGCKDSVYNIIIGYPDNRYPEKLFVININKADHGYTLKNTGTQLEDVLGERIIYGAQPPFVKDTLYGERKANDAFASLMSGVVNDSAVLFASVKPIMALNKVTADSDSRVAVAPSAKKNAAAAVPVGTVSTGSSSSVTTVTNDSLAVRKATAIDVAPAVVSTEDTKLIEKAPESPRATIKRITEVNDVHEKRIVFADITSTYADTILVTIPLEEETIATVPASKDSLSQQATAANAINAPVSVNKDTQSVIKDTSTVTKPETTAVSKVKDTDAAAPAQPVVAVIVNDVNKNCRNIATDQDVDKLRIKMLEAITSYERIEVAKKIIRIKCYSAQQIKALSELFANEEGLFKFFEIAYPNTSDQGKFRELVSMFRTQEYIYKFKMLVN